MRDMAADGHWAKGVARAIYTNGYVERWTYLGQACGYRESVTGSVPIRDMGRGRIAKI